MICINMNIIKSVEWAKGKNYQVTMCEHDQIH